MRFPERCAVCWFLLPTDDVEYVDPLKAIARCGGCGEWVTAWPETVTRNPHDVPELSTAKRTEN